jgi:hypothetical protein
MTLSISAKLCEKLDCSIVALCTRDGLRDVTAEPEACDGNDRPLLFKEYDLTLYLILYLKLIKSHDVVLCSIISLLLSVTCLYWRAQYPNQRTVPT